MKKRMILGLTIFILFMSGLLVGSSYPESENPFWIAFSVIVVMITLTILELYIRKGQNNKGEMNGCLVLTLIELNQIMGLDILFVWIDVHYPQLFKEYIAFIDKKAKEYKAKRIISITKKSAKLIERKYGKYGYKKVYNIFVKEVN